MTQPCERRSQASWNDERGPDVVETMHPNLAAAGRWFELSLMEQLGNIGTEVYVRTMFGALQDPTLLMYGNGDQ